MNNINLKKVNIKTILFENIYIFVSIIGFVYLLTYVLTTADNVVYADNIRNVVRYFDKPFSLELAWQPTSIHRQPAALPIMYLNIYLFKYNIIAEMIISIFSILISSFIIALYCKQNKLSSVIFCVVSVLLFSLNQWEMILNNTGVVIYIAFVLIYWSFKILDDYYVKNKRTKLKSILINLIPVCNILLFAGGYSAAYALVIIVLLLFLLAKMYLEYKKIDKSIIINILCIIVAMLIYSNGLDVSEGGKSFFTTFFNNPVYGIKFFIISFSSVFMGTETITKMFSINICILIGTIVLLAYGVSTIIYIKMRIYRKTMFPIMLMLFSFVSHILVLYSRIFFNDITYGMSSRYYVQYVPGIIGIIIIFSFVLKEKLSHKLSISFPLILSISVIIFFVTGNLITNFDEVNKSKYRHAYFENLRQMALDYTKYSDKDLLVFQNNPQDVRTALEILERKKLNVFSKSNDELVYKNGVIMKNKEKLGIYGTMLRVMEDG